MASAGHFPGGEAGSRWGQAAHSLFLSANHKQGPGRSGPLPGAPKRRGCREGSALDAPPPGLGWLGTLHVWRAASPQEGSWAAHLVSLQAQETGQPLPPPLLSQLTP